MSIPIRQPTSAASQRRLSAQPNRQHEGTSPSRFSGLFGMFLGQASDPPPPPPPERRTTFKLQDYLPQAVEEKAITDAVDVIQVHLEGHVNHFYGPKLMARVSENDVAQNRDSSPAGGEQRHSLQEKPLSRAPTPRSSSYTHVSNLGHLTSSSLAAAASTAAEERRCKNKVYILIATRLIKAIQPSKAGEEAEFLPAELTFLLSALPLPEDMEDDQVFNSALSQWRTLSWYLLYHKKVRKANEQHFKKRLDREMDQMLKSLDKELEPYVDASKNEERREHLRSLMELTADLGRLISSQAVVYEFSWDYESDAVAEQHGDHPDPRDTRSNRDSHHPGRIRKTKSWKEVTVLFPALLKTSDRHGLRLTKPQCICEPQTERIKVRIGRKRTEEAT